MTKALGSGTSATCVVNLQPKFPGGVPPKKKNPPGGLLETKEPAAEVWKKTSWLLPTVGGLKMP